MRVQAPRRHHINQRQSSRHGSHNSLYLIKPPRRNRQSSSPSMIRCLWSGKSICGLQTERQQYKASAGFGFVSMRPALHQILIFFLLVTRVMNEEQRVNVCKTGLNQIYTMLRTAPQNWRNYINLARSVVAHLDSMTFMQQASRTTEQAWMIAGLQRLSSVDTDNGGVPDIAAWCSRQWLTIFQRDPQNIAALRGIGESWLSRAQPTLARMQQAETSSPSSGGSSHRSAPSNNTGDEERQSTTATAEAERRAGTQDYVEARGFLQPATEYLERAVAAAIAQRALSGDLLATVRLVTKERLWRHRR